MTKVKKGKVKAAVPDQLVDEDFLKFALTNYATYMMSVIEDRAVPDYRDGMIPVSRRVLWSMHDLGIRSNAKPVKSARVVGDVLGRFHPHGDQSTYGAMVNMTNRNTPFQFIQGDGNWGSMTEPAYAAMRYTEARLHKNADQIMFDRFYTPVMDFAPNFDGSGTEPLILPAVLPVLLLTGKMGVAPGATSRIPACTYKSLVQTLVDALENKGVVDAAAAYKTIRFTSTSGGKEILPTEKEAKVARAALFKGPKGKAVLGSTYEVDSHKLKITVTAFGDHWAMQSLIESLLKLEAVKSAVDDTTKGDKYATLIITIKPSHKKDFEKIVKQIVDKQLTVKKNYELNFTERYIDADGLAQARLRPMSITQMLQEWLTYRLALESKACAYWMTEATKQIRRLELLIMACDNLDFLFKLLKSKADRQTMDKEIAKKFKITTDEAHVITEMKFYQLSRLAKQELQAEIKTIEANRKELGKRKDKPAPYVLKQLKALQ